MADENEIDAALADALTSLWRTGRKLGPAERQAARHLQAAFDSFARAGLTVQGHDGVVFAAGMALEVVAYEPRPGVAADVVVETVRPCVYRGSERLQVGQVIVARPEQKKGRRS